MLRSRMRLPEVVFSQVGEEFPFLDEYEREVVRTRSESVRSSRAAGSGTARAIG